MKPNRTQLLLFIAICLGLLLGSLPGAALAQESQPRDATAADAPRDCINPIMAAHIAASIASVLPIPIPGWKTAADLAEFGANIALKGCPPDFYAPADVVKPPPPNCVLRLRLPLDATYNELNEMDDKFFAEVMSITPLPGDAKAGLQDLIASPFGRFENETYGSYSNIYGMELPLELSEWASGDWGDVGQPDIFHYNSDVFLTLRHPGRRVNAQIVEFRPGSYVLSWQADTMISAFDYIPTFLIPSPFSDSPAGQKAAKEAATETSKKAAKQAAKEAAEETTSQFIKRKATELVKNILKKGGMKAGAATLKLRQPYFVSGEPNATTVDSQRLIVQDHTAPIISGVNPVTVEAFAPGGAVSAASMPKLMAAITVTDDCDLDPSLSFNTPAFWPLQVDDQGNPLPSSTITWKAQDNGAATPTGGRNETTVVQEVTVVDTLPPILLPPPPVIMEAEAGNGIEVALGTPQVFDVADLRPTINYDAPGTTQGATWPIFTPGVYNVEWIATDRSKNQSEAKTQLVNIKLPGTNIPPTANSLTGANAVTVTADEPFTITVTGQDGNTPPDPIWFTVDEQPEHGYFIAPLYPYFIDDYRMTARYSPTIAQWDGEDVAWQVAQNTSAMRDYMIDLCEEDINRTDLPKDFISWNGGGEKYLAVDDEGYTYIYDWAYRKCTHGGSTIAPNGSPRISVWDANGVYVGEQVRSDGGYPLKDIKFNIARGTILSVESDGSTTGSSLVNISRIQPQNTAEPIVDVQSYSLWNKINRIDAGNGVTRQPEYKNAGAAALDDDRNILYVVGDRNHNSKGMAAFRPTRCDSQPNDDPDACLELLGVQVYAYDIVQSTKWDAFPGIGVDAMRLQQVADITLDSLGNVYLAVRVDNNHRFDRIYKFAAATVHDDGSVELGELIGWMGRCDSGENCNYIDGNSIGFSCTDDTCAVATTYGSGPGQFDGIAALALDPNDVLYVADSGNKRVQRFNRDGLFAGEARSQESCAGCTGFVLGDFGAPGNIAVNSNHFYILDIDTELVHVFEASVIHSIDERSAWVEYRSDSNYVGPDFFTFRATDGFRKDGSLVESPPARVDLVVNRNFRPPQATIGLTISTTEDTPAPITLTGYDLDGDQDTLTFQVSTPPLYGALTGTSPNLVYTPDEDFYGEDSFTFVVQDGRFTSEEESVAIEVTEANDPPQVSINGDALHSGAGYPWTLDAVVVDADHADSHEISVDWGDGSSATTGSFGDDGTLSGPVLIAGDTVTSTVLGYHTYNNTGAFPVTLCATDAANVEDCDTKTVQIDNSVDLQISRSGRTITAANDRTLSYEFLIQINPPENGSPVVNGIVVTESLERGATYTGASTTLGTCTASGQSLSCSIPGLASGNSASITVNVRLDDSLQVGDLIEAHAEVKANGADPISGNNVHIAGLTLLPQADYLVDNDADSSDASPGDGICATEDNRCTLRAAVEEANARSGAQTIALGYGIHNLNIVEASGRLRASGAPMVVNDALTILGLSPNRTVIHANGQNRLFTVNGATLVLRDLMLTGGLAPDSGNGGAILATGSTLLLERVTLTGNRAVDGGAIASETSSLTLADSTVSDNEASARGGGLFSASGSVTLRNVTLTGNRAARGGGLFAGSATVELQNVTVAGNNAVESGGGLLREAGSVKMVNTILSDNNAAEGPNCSGGVESTGHNLIGNGQGCTVSGDTATNQNPPTPRMATREINEAETYSYRLLPDSPAIDNGTCLQNTDQRGAERPYGGGCDIGAYEYNPLAGLDEILFLSTISR